MQAVHRKSSERFGSWRLAFRYCITLCKCNKWKYVVSISWKCAGSQEENDDSGEAVSAASSEDTNEQTDDDDGSVEASDDASAADGGSSEEGEDAPSLEVADEPYVDEVVVESDDAEAPKPEDSGEDNSQEEGDEQTEQSSAEDADSKEDAQDDGDSNEASAEDENAEDGMFLLIFLTIQIEWLCNFFLIFK